MVEVDPLRGSFGKGGVLRTLGGYRRERGRIVFGVFVKREGETGGGESGVIGVGDNVIVTRKEAG